MTSPTEFPDGYTFSSLLVPVDLSVVSDRILGRVPLLPLSPNARLTLLHVVSGSLPIVMQRRAERDARKAIAEEAKHLAKSLPESVTVVQAVRVGSAATEIAACSAESGAEMIVMGRGGGSALREVFLGSTAERVLRRTQLPVLVVRLPARAPYTRPALALDGEDGADTALTQLLRVIPTPGLRIAVIHAYEPPYRGMIHSSPREDEGDDVSESAQPDAALRIGMLLTSALARTNLPPASAPVWNAHIQLGSARTIIPESVRKDDNDLLVLGTRGHSGLAYAFLGSVAGEVLRAVNCDVLVVPPSNQQPVAGGNENQ